MIRTPHRTGVFALGLLLLLGSAGVARAQCAEPGPALAKNIILLISDGCGYNHVDAASLYQYGKTGVQVYERFPVRIGMSTYMVNGSPAGYALGGYDPFRAWSVFDYVKTGFTDSAAAATAMSTGIKTHDGAIGLDLNGRSLTHFMDAAESRGKATGVVTSVVFSHGTPAGFVAHNAWRRNHEAIAREMIYRSAADVIMGCGAPDYDDDGKAATGPTTYVGGAAAWADLKDGSVLGADADGDSRPDKWVVIRSRSEFKALAIAKGAARPKRVIGLPRVHQTLQQTRGGDAWAAPYAVPQTTTVPTLAEMTAAALNVLAQDPDGFCLMVEGGAVDWASHLNQSGRVIEEEVAFNRAVEAVVAWVNTSSSWNETLVIVTSDHETGCLTGPGSGPGQPGPVWTSLVNKGRQSQPGMAWHTGDHTNALIPFYAKGAASTLFLPAAIGVDPRRGRYVDNTDVGHLAFTILGTRNPNRPLQRAGTWKTGQTGRMDLDFGVAMAGKIYRIALSSTDAPGVSFGAAGTLHLAPDVLFFTSAFGGPPIFHDFTGVLDALGRAPKAPSVMVPNLTALVGTRLYAGALAVDKTGVIQVSNTCWLPIR